MPTTDPLRARWQARRAGQAGGAAPALPPGGCLHGDIAYGRWPAQRLDIYRPAQGDRCPVLVVVHGGAWVVGDKARADVVENKVAHWLPRGWVVVSVNYRMLPWADPREQATDVARAIAAVQDRIGDFGGAPGDIVLMGHSTGAHLVALVLSDPAIGEACGLRALRGAVLLDSAAFDVVQMMEDSHLALHDRAFGADPQFWRAASPWHCLRAAPPPMLLVASADREGSVRQARRFADRAVELGGDARVLAVPLGHAEINQQVGRDGALTEAIDAFLATLLGPARP